MQKEQVTHVGQLANSARSVWLASLAFYAFSLIAVAAVRDRDFFVGGVRTELPLIGVSVPTVAFFVATPVLVLAVYQYLLFYVVKLWKGVGGLPLEVRLSESGGAVPLSSAIQPSLLVEAAMALRSGAAEAEFGRFSFLATCLLVWWGGPAVLVLFWFRSWPYHSVLLTTFIAILSIGALGTGFLAHAYARRAARGRSLVGFPRRRQVRTLVGTSAALIIAFGVISVLATSGVGGAVLPLWKADLYQVEIVDRPHDWLPRQQAELTYLADYGGVSRSELAALLEEEQASSGDEWFSRDEWLAPAREQFVEQRNHFLLALDRTSLAGANLRAADRRYSFLPGVDLRGADLGGAHLFAAEMEGALMSDVDLTGAALGRSHLSCARLERAHLDNGYLVEAKLDRATLSNASLTGANLRKADLSGANLINAKLQWTNLSGADLSDSIITKEELVGAVGSSNTILPPSDPPFRIAKCFVDLDQAEIERISKAWRMSKKAFSQRFVCSEAEAKFAYGPVGERSTASDIPRRCWPNAVN